MAFPLLRNGLVYLVSPCNRPYNICDECWDKLDEPQQETEREIRTIRINENGDLWLGRYSAQDLIEMCNKVIAMITIYESRIKELEENALIYSSKIMYLEDEIDKLMGGNTLKSNYESRIKKLEADNFRLTGEMLDLTSTMTNKVIAMNESIRIWNNYIKEEDKIERLL